MVKNAMGHPFECRCAGLVTDYSDGIGVAKDSLAGTNMKKIILSALVVSSSLAFTNAPLYAAQNDDIAARVEALEKENAAIKKELAARREQKDALKRTSRPQAGAVGSAPASGKQLPAMDITHQDLGIGYPAYHSGFGGPYGDGNYPE